MLFIIQKAIFKIIKKRLDIFEAFFLVFNNFFRFITLVCLYHEKVHSFT